MTIVPTLTRLLTADERLRFVTIGDRFDHLFPAELRSRVEAVPGTATAAYLDPDWFEDSQLGVVRYYELAKRMELDIAVAPIEHTTFNRCKSDLKLKEYGALGLPTVATRFGPYARYQERSPETVALMARTASEWESALRALIDSQDLRASLATANLSYVRNKHLLSIGLASWEEALLTVLVQAAHSRRRCFLVAMAEELQSVSAG